MRKRLGFLGLLASLIIVFFSNSSFAAGYSCTKTYLSCKPGYYLSGEDCLVCPVGKYCTGGTTAPQNCPAGTYRNTTGGTSSSSCTACSTLANGFYPNSAAGSDAANDCYTNSLSGKYVASAKASSATNCSAGYYKGSHTVKYGSTSSCSACTGATYSAAGASSCTSCPSDSSAVSINTNDRTSRSGCYATYGSTNLTGNDGHVDSYRCMIDSSTDTYGVSSRCRTDFSNLTCAAGYYSSDKEEGYSDTYWSGKTTFLSETCRAVGTGYYSPADSLTRTSCTSLGAIYTASDSGYDASTDCYATTSAGKWLASAKATAFSTCSAGDYCPGSIKVYYNSTGGKKDCPSGYPNSAAGSSLITQCYSNTKSRAWTGSQVNGSTPTNCYSVTAWNSCSKPACDYVAYSNSAGTGDGTIKSGCSSNSANCKKSPAAVTAKSGYYVSGVTCPACSGLASGFYPNSSNGNTGGTSACYTNSLSGKYVASAKASSATNCSAGYYKGSHTVKYGSTSSCSACTNKPANTIYTGNATSNSCPWACAGGYYLLNGQCTDCGNGYYCVEGSNVRVACSTLVPSSAPTPSALRSLSNGSWSDYNHAVKSSDCICDWYLSDETRTQYLNQTACYNGPSGNDYTHYNWCRTGYYATDPLNFNEWYNSCSPCTNKPAHSKYTSYSTPSVMYAEESNCPWQCDEGYYKSGNSCLECGGNNYYCTGGSRYTVSSGYYSTGGTSTTRTGQSACGGNNYYCSGGVRYTVSSGYYSTGGTSTTRTGQSQCSGAVYCSGGVQNNCPAQTSGWTRGTGTGWTSYSSCYQTKSATAVSSYCSSGQLKQVGASSTTWGTATVSSAFNAKPGSIVSGSGASTTCTQCSGAVYSGGGTATSCSSCPAQTSGWTRGTGTGWTSYSSCYQTKSATAVSSYCSSGQLKQVGASSTTWGTATVSSAFNAKPGAYVTGSGASSTCSQCTSGYYCPGGTTTRQSCSSLADGFYPNSAAGSDAATDCYTNSLSGKYVASAKASSATNCAAGYYKGSHTVKYGSTSSCSACTGATYSAAGASSCTSCPADSSATSISSNNRTSRSGCYATYGSTNLTGNDGHVDSYRCMIDSSTDTYGVSSTCRTDFSNLTCAAGYYSTDKEAGNSDTYWSGKTRFLSATCQAVGTGYYSPADSLTRTSCTSLGAIYTASDSGYDASTDCYATTSAGKWLASAKATAFSTCSAGDYCPGSIKVYYNSIGGNKDCPSNYPNSGSGSSLITQCYSNTKSRAWTGSQVNGSTPTNCYSVTSWNSCSNPACSYVAYSNSAGTGDGTIKSGCSSNSANCKKSPAAVTAKSGYYVSGVTCPACSGLASGFYPNSNNGNTGGASACYTDSLSGKYVASAKASSATSCSAGYYKGSHTVKYGSTSSCSACTGATYSAAGASSCTSCPSDSSAVSINTNDRTSRSGCYATYGSTNLTGNDGHVDSYRCMIDSSTDTYGASTSTKCIAEFSDLTCAAGYYSSDKEEGYSNTYWWGKTNFLNSACKFVGSGYYSPADSLTRIACDAGLTTIGFGPGADEPADCGRVLNIGDEKIYLRSEKKTTPSLNVSINGDIFYGNMGTSGKGSLKIKSGSTTYSVYDDSM